MKKTHVLKLDPEYFDPIEQGMKTFEIRKEDRPYSVGDLVLLREFDRFDFRGADAGEIGGTYTGRRLQANIGLGSRYEQKPGYVVFSLINVERIAND